ncbi:MAG: putative toxin-antitoxin system toxin component, PIN family [Candidatus Levybacteria bacterium]|nr:putative toxin-antitoxin system toxin component, PIN family [Candidatus Levybacteria bacterium]MBI3092721.1 putative toxin-antitoxin system toxin component, PIN family [Candidatus Levybacteria bacterium]
MASKPRVVLDSNILISAYVFGGKPESVFNLILAEQTQGVTSRILISEFLDVLRKKFKVSQTEILEIQSEIENIFEVVYPKKTFNIVKDFADNRVLEAATEGGCTYIVTGDKELLELGRWKGISIITADQFLERIKDFF